MRESRGARPGRDVGLARHFDAPYGASGAGTQESSAESLSETVTLDWAARWKIASGVAASMMASSAAGVGDVDLLEFRSCGNALGLARREVVDHCDADVVGEKRLSKMASDEPRPTGQNDGSGRSSSGSCSRAREHRSTISARARAPSGSTRRERCRTVSR
jgi:hypothetical protein